MECLKKCIIQKSHMEMFLIGKKMRLNISLKIILTGIVKKVV